MTTANAMSAGSAVADVDSRRTTTRALLAGGVVAGPLFGVVAAAQVLTRDGFDLSRQPLSLLALGDLGWIQIANFVLTGLLALAGAVGLRRVLRGEPGGTWGPALIAVHGLGLIIAGVLVSDPSMGWPTGAPEGAPATLSWHAVGHGVGAGLAFGSLPIACLIFARTWWRAGQRGWATFSLGSALAVVAILAWPDQDTLSVRMALACVPTFGWLAALCTRSLTR
ncbi:DUF998 domain-containing protein [Micromonospora sp. LH3U1]|uniref:DUF998 domain-containing protein n=1 Tax=Micromonospora sp. LH3U1 TaxID=3018339 RepID=UPI0023495059|nr:DUF998 domain-containing protein [Micromonospora sp. LH3U1]WCN82508.1 DUF998 domain-containing protein [Micromonospora sp. LH3U1]